jgi:hypothetical protein
VQSLDIDKPIPTRNFWQEVGVKLDTEVADPAEPIRFSRPESNSRIRNIPGVRVKDTDGFLFGTE